MFIDFTEYPISLTIFSSIYVESLLNKKSGTKQIFCEAMCRNIFSMLQYGLSSIRPIVNLHLKCEQYKTAEDAPILLPHNINLLILNYELILLITA